MDSGSRILSSNLAQALHIAIETLKKQEQSIAKDFCSTYRAGLESNLEYLKMYGTVTDVLYLQAN